MTHCTPGRRNSASSSLYSINQLIVLLVAIPAAKVNEKSKSRVRRPVVEGFLPSSVDTVNLRTMTFKRSSVVVAIFHVVEH